MSRTELPSSLHLRTNGGEDSIRIASAEEAGLSGHDICAFYAQHWLRPIALTREDFAHWQFNEAPTAGAKNHSIVALDGDQVLAVMGVTPSSFNVGGRLRRGAELTTWVVAPEARGRRIGKRMLAELQNRFEVLTGAGITNAAVPL